MNYEKLEQLISIPKKTDASKATRREYKTEISKLLNEEGFSENAEKYLWSGFSFCGAGPIFDYINSNEKEIQLKIIDSLFKCRTYSKNEKSNGFKMCISLLAYELNYTPDNLDIICMLIKSCIGKYKKKDGTISKDNTKIVEKYFVSIISEEAKLPDWNTINLTTGIICDFCKYLIETCSSITGDKSKEKIKIIISWLESGLPNQEQNNTSALESKNSNNKEPAEADKKSEEQTDEKQGINIETADTLFDIAEQLKRLSVKTLFFATESEKTKKIVEQLNVKNKELTDKINDSECSIAQLKKQLTTKDEELTEKKTQISEYESEIEKLKTVISVYSEDKQSSMDGQLNAIASKLKTEYREFKDALDLEMTAEIGEILRDQLMRVFKILAKAGIDIESR